MTDFSDHFRKNIRRYKRIGYNLNVMRQSACSVINPITVDGYATLFYCTPVDRASESKPREKFLTSCAIKQNQDQYMQLLSLVGITDIVCVNKEV